MCLAVPAKVISITGQMAQVELGGLTRQANIMLVPGLRLAIMSCSTLALPSRPWMKLTPERP